MTTNNHPAHGPVSLDRLHQIREILSKAAAQSDGGNLGCAMADAVKVIDVAIAAMNANPVAWRYRYVHTPKTEEHGSPFTTEWKLCDSEDECNPSDCFERQPLYTAPQLPQPVPDEMTPKQASRSYCGEVRGYRYVHTPKTEEHGSPFTTEWKLCDSEDECNPSDCFERQPLYTAPQLPQPVPDEMTPKQASRSYCGEVRGYRDGWNACRAAMLQAGNSPKTPDGWQLVPKEPTAAMNKAGWDAMNEHDAINPTYRAMLAAAPQQENV